MMIRSAALSAPTMPWQRELLHLMALTMDACWLILWFMVLAPGAALLPTSVNAIFVYGNMLAALLLIRASQPLGISTRLLRWLVLGGLIAGIVLALYVVLPADGLSILASSFPPQKVPFVPGPAVVVALMILIWYRGIHVATALFTPARTGFGFRLGLLLMVGVALFSNERLQSDLITLLPLFFASGLMASMLARQASLRTNREVQRASFGRQWIGFNGGIALIVVGVGFVASLLLAGYGLEGASNALKTILLAFGILVSVIIAPLLLILESVIRWVLGHVTFHSRSLEDFQNQINQLMSRPVNQVDLRPYAAVFDVIRYVCIGAVVLSVVVVIFAMLRDREGNRMVEGEERENLEREGLIKTLGSSLLNALSGLFAGRDARQRLDDARTIRRLYARLIAQAAALGYPRETAQTPFEYQPQLVSAFPGFNAEIERVTRAYVNVHYGELPDSPDEVAAVQNAVERMIASVEAARSSNRRQKPV